MKARTAFLLMIPLGIGFTGFGLLTDLVNVGIGVAVACIGVIGYEYQAFAGVELGFISRCECGQQAVVDYPDTEYVCPLCEQVFR